MSESKRPKKPTFDVMSNFDHVIEPGSEERLKAGEVGRHAAWDFHGSVWWDAERRVFVEELWVYGTPREIVEAPTLEALKTAACDAGGYG